MKILNSIYKFLENFGRARAAMHLAAMGDHEGARRINELKGRTKWLTTNPVHAIITA